MLPLLNVVATPAGCRFPVRVQPRASRDEVVGVQEDHLRVRLTAPPVEGQANATLVDLLARRLGVRRSTVSIVSGETGRLKWVEVEGLTPEEVVRRLGLDEARGGAR